MKRAILIGLFLLGLLAAGAAKADVVYSNFSSIDLTEGQMNTPAGLSRTFNTAPNSLGQWAVTTVSVWVNITGATTTLTATILGHSLTQTVAKSGFKVFYKVDFNFTGMGLVLPAGNPSQLFKISSSSINESNWVYTGASGLGGGSLEVNGNAVPAPAALALLGFGSVGLAFIRRRKAQKA